MLAVGLWLRKSEKMKNIFLFAAAITLLLSGCATIVSLQEDGKNKIYSGTIKHFELGCAHAVCLDFPFSLAADTVVLPYTIPRTIYNCISSDESQEKTGTKQHNGDSEKQ